MITRNLAALEVEVAQLRSEIEQIQTWVDERRGSRRWRYHLPDKWKIAEVLFACASCGLVGFFIGVTLASVEFVMRGQP